MLDFRIIFLSPAFIEVYKTTRIGLLRTRAFPQSCTYLANWALSLLLYSSWVPTTVGVQTAKVRAGSNRPGTGGKQPTHYCCERLHSPQDETNAPILLLISFRPDGPRPRPSHSVGLQASPKEHDEHSTNGEGHHGSSRDGACLLASLPKVARSLFAQ